MWACQEIPPAWPTGTQHLAEGAEVSSQLGKAASLLWLSGKVVTADGTASLTQISICLGSPGQK